MKLVHHNWPVFLFIYNYVIRLIYLCLCKMNFFVIQKRSISFRHQYTIQTLRIVNYFACKVYTVSYAPNILL
ncbi:hypothetical protein [Lonomia obliqua multiple nucleopolyhedrovirus]|uniref:Uncharacterized protein n=1 Tax=Lonomia obliqua multiple nucleopolyhedrovirus TaxID=134394 RepID=A0A126FC97_9ABAC|nr:hypothetical protein [Lonomia obliqua multiple nucleopolyhedrovirus]AKN81026.1 hypothetical protein [Lonomia obliqua multiple nucleopolyhedrovirus]